MTTSTIKSALIGVSFIALSFGANAQECSKDEAMKMYAKVTDHAAALKADAQANPSKIPFQSGKNDPRLKKSKKISSKASAINSGAIDASEFGKACTELTVLAKKYKISLEDGDATVSTKEKVGKGFRIAGQAQSLKNQVD